MAKPAMPPLVMILGSGRSGTTWLGRIFDSLPTTVYLHEPDLVVYDSDLPVVPAPEEFDNLLPYTDRLLDRLVAARPLKSMSNRPVFRKAYRSAAAHWARVGVIYGMRGFQEIAGKWVEKLTVPDLIDRPAKGPLTTVIKSVTGLARLPYFATARPDMPIIHVLRHPCAVGASLLRGVSKGKMPEPALYDRQLALPPARRRGLDRSAADRLTPLQLSTWRWLIMNEWAMESRPRDGRVRTIRYEDICEDPKGEGRRLFEWCGLPWSPETEAFLDASLDSKSDATGYHSVIRNPAIAANRWREKMSPEEVDTVYDIIGDSEPGRLFPR